jgi:hypothetical protein
MPAQNCLYFRKCERYNQIVRRTVYIVEIVLESKNGRYISKEEGCSQASLIFFYFQFWRRERENMELGQSWI